MPDLNEAPSNLSEGASRGMPPGIPGPTTDQDIEEAIDRVEEATLPATERDHLFQPGAVLPIGELDALARVYSEGEIQRMTLADRIRHYWSVIDTFTEQAVVGAEALLGPGTGSEKKSYVTQQVMGLLDKIEKRVNVIPDWIQPVVFHAFRFGVNMTIERVVRSFKSRGTI